MSTFQWRPVKHIYHVCDNFVRKKVALTLQAIFRFRNLHQHHIRWNEKVRHQLHHHYIVIDYANMHFPLNIRCNSVTWIFFKVPCSTSLITFPLVSLSKRYSLENSNSKMLDMESSESWNFTKCTIKVSTEMSLNPKICCCCSNLFIFLIVFVLIRLILRFTDVARVGTVNSSCSL